MTPFSGGSRGTHCNGRQNVSGPVQAVVVRQMRREEPIRVNPVSQVNVHMLPVVRPVGQRMVPFCGEVSTGHIRAIGRGIRSISIVKFYLKETSTDNQ